MRDHVSIVHFFTEIPEELETVDDLRLIKREKIVAERQLPCNSPEIQDDWILFNAPRPLAGDTTWGGGVYRHGVLWAAIDPHNEYAHANAEFNLRMDASLVSFTPYADVISFIVDEADDYHAQHPRTSVEKFLNYYAKYPDCLSRYVTAHENISFEDVLTMFSSAEDSRRLT